MGKRSQVFTSQPPAVPFIRHGEDRRAPVDFVTIHEDCCCKVKRDHDVILGTTTFKLYCGPNLILLVPLEEAAQLLATIPNLDKLGAERDMSFSPKLPVTWQYAEGEKGPYKKLVSITWIAPVPWALDNDKYKFFLTERARCGEELIYELLGKDKATWPSEADALSIVKQRQSQDALNAFIPRDKRNKPVEDTTVNKYAEKEEVKTLKDYFKENDKKRKSFFQSAHNLCKSNGIEDAKAQDARIHEILSPDDPNRTLNDVEMDPDTALKAIADHFTKNGKGKPSRPTTSDIDVTRLTIKELFANHHIEDKGAYKAATGDENLVVSIDAGKSLDSITAAVRAYCTANKPKEADKPEEATDTTAEASDTKSEPENKGEPEKGQETAEPKKIEPSPLLSEIKTLTGIPVGRISEAMNRRFSPAAYDEIPTGPMKGGTDLAFEDVRDRFDHVFGPHGFGWKFEPHPVLGKIEYRAEQRKSAKGDDYTRHVVTFVCHVFKYAVINSTGELVWVEVSPMSDSDENQDCGYAYRGAFTSLLKQVLRSFGGMNHILRGEYTHKQANKAA